MIREFCYQRIIISTLPHMHLWSCHMYTPTLAHAQNYHWKYTSSLHLTYHLTTVFSLWPAEALFFYVNQCTHEPPHVSTCRCVCVWKSSRTNLCRKDRNDYPFVTKLSNHLCMGWYFASAGTESTRDRGEEGGWGALRQRETGTDENWKIWRNILPSLQSGFQLLSHHSLN